MPTNADQSPTMQPLPNASDPSARPNTGTAGNALPGTMSSEVRWLVRLGIDAGLFSNPQCLRAWRNMGTGTDLVGFAQHLIDSCIVSDVEALENIVVRAMTDGKKGAPPNDPFADDGPLVAPPATADTPVAATSGVTFAFDTIAQLDDQALAAAMGELLRSTARDGASDLHLSSGARPFIRRRRELAYLADHSLTSDDALRLNLALLSEDQKRSFLERRDFDYALALNESDRYRVNLMFQKNGAAGAYRMISAETRTLTDLGYAAHLTTFHQLLSYHNGLILVTGPVGSGKTTTLASMVNHLNETRSDHIITIEDPIEVVQPSKGCNVTQREVGAHTGSFATALKGALREDPDVIVIGELRDLETIEMAITASETGHLVLGTMHTSDAATTLNRILDVFPPEQQTQIRATVAESLRGVICQRLLPARDGSLALVYEILVNNTAVQNLIREGKTQGVRNTMETGAREGMCLMDNAVFNRWKDGKISAETALDNIGNRVIRARIT